MASQVKVIDPSARQVIIKTTPGKYLSEVRDEACTKLRLEPEQYMLKRNDKTIDLSLTYRLSGLPSGSKLELIQRSKSPSIVSVALQIPPGLSADGLATRLISKFPSDKTLWQILRTFESGNVDGSNRSWNFTERTVRGGENEVYAFPRLHVMGRDYSSIGELQKTLAHLGFNDGSVLIKLDLLPMQKTLQQAKTEMERYFVETKPVPAIEKKILMTDTEPSPTQDQDLQSEETTTGLADITNDTTLSQPPEPMTTSSPATTTISSRPTTVFAPPSRNTPLASTLQTSESDFEPTIESLKSHQSTITSAARNKRLLTDAEISAQSAASAEKLSAVISVDVKIVFPDQSSVQAPFSRNDTAKELYDYVRSLLRDPAAGFSLSYAKGKGMAVINETTGQNLIKDLGFAGRVLVRVIWDDATGMNVRQNPSLKDDVKKLAGEIKIMDFSGVEVDGGGEQKEVKKDGKEKKAGGGSGKGIPKWLKLPGKK